MEESKNIYQRLALARKEFLEKGIQKSGNAKNYNYFELKDIVPIATEVFDNNGLLLVVNFAEGNAIGTLYNTDDPTQTMETTIDLSTTVNIPTTRDGGTIMNSVQWIGSKITYIRRYMYMLVLDIIEDDEIDKLDLSNSLGYGTPATQKAINKAQNVIANDNSKATELRDLIMKAKEVDSEGTKDLREQIRIETNNLLNITDDAFELYKNELLKVIGGDASGN